MGKGREGQGREGKGREGRRRFVGDGILQRPKGNRVVFSTLGFLMGD